MQHQPEDSLNDTRTANSSLSTSPGSTADALRDALIAGVIAGDILTPLSHIDLLKATIKAATQIVDAEYGTLFRYDASTQELVFEASEGGAAKDLKQFRMPADKGIAGHVAQTRQTLLVNDVAKDSHWNIKVGMQVMFAPRNILCVPLLWGEKLIGVLQVCDKANEADFTETDSKILELFASQAAASIGLSLSHQSAVSLTSEMLGKCNGVPKDQKESLHQQAFSLTQFTRDDPQYKKRLDLVRHVHGTVSGTGKSTFTQRLSTASSVFWQLLKG